MFEYDIETGPTIRDLLRAVNDRLGREQNWRLVQVLYAQDGKKSVIFAGILETER